MTNLIYDTLKELDLLHYWSDLSDYKFSKIVDPYNNQIIEDIFDRDFEFMLETDKSRLKQSLMNCISCKKLGLDLNNKSDDTENDTTDRKIQPLVNNFEKHHLDDITNDKDNMAIVEEKIPNKANHKNSKISTKDMTQNNGGNRKNLKKPKIDDVTCIHRITYKVYGSNNFVPNYTKRYYVESTGEELNGLPENNNIVNLKPNGHPSSNVICSNTYDNNVGSSSYNRNYYHPYQTHQPRYYSHNRIFSEPSKYHIYEYHNSHLYTNVNNKNQNNNTGIIPNVIPFPQRFHQSNYYPSSTSQTDNTTSEYNHTGYKSQSMESQNKYCHIFEGSKAMENSPLHKYNLLDPPIFKYHSIRIPSSIPFLIRLDSLDEDRVNMIKNASIIFGRSDNRRKSPSLNLNEMLMNEIAFQLCLRDPLYLISRQKLIMESREIIRESGHRIQDDVNIVPFEESSDKTSNKPSSNANTIDYNNTNVNSVIIDTDNNDSNKLINCNNTKSQIVNDVKNISEVRDAPILPANDTNKPDPFIVQEDISSVQCRNLMAKYCYDDYDTIYYYKLHKKWPQNAESSRKAYLRRKSKKFKVIDNHLYSISTSSERLRLWLRDIDAVVENAPRFHYKENGDHFTRNETISRMLRYCYSNDIPHGVNKFIKNCTVCMEKEWRENSNDSCTSMVGTQSGLTTHQLLSSTDDKTRYYDSVKYTTINDNIDKHSPIDINDDNYMRYTNETSVEINHNNNLQGENTIDKFNDPIYIEIDKSPNLINKPTSFDSIEIDCNSPSCDEVDTIDKSILGQDASKPSKVVFGKQLN